MPSSQTAIRIVNVYGQDCGASTRVIGAIFDYRGPRFEASSVEALPSYARGFVLGLAG